MHRGREAGRFQMDDHSSLPGDCGRLCGLCMISVQSSVTQATQPTAPRPLGRTPWLLLAALLLHILEEWAGFPQWATVHFGTTTAGFYLASHVPIVVLAVWIVARAARVGATTLDVWIFGVALIAFATNAVFHLIATGLFMEYSPGLVTGVLLYLPLTARLWPQLTANLGRRSARRAALLGVGLSVFVIASLMIDMPTW